MQTMDDATLWRLFRKGNAQVFEIVYNRYISLLANYGRRLCGDDEMVKDAIQDLFVDLWKNRKNLRSTDSIQYYLIKALRRNLIKKLNSARKQIQMNIDTPGFELSPELKIINSESHRELKDRLHANLNTLSTRQKEIVFLRFYCGMTYSAISKIMSINSQSAYNIVHRVLNVLREQMLHKIPLLLVILYQAVK